jgi:hypothetical protein
MLSFAYRHKFTFVLKSFHEETSFYTTLMCMLTPVANIVLSVDEIKLLNELQDKSHLVFSFKQVLVLQA